MCAVLCCVVLMGQFCTVPYPGHIYQCSCAHILTMLPAETATARRDWLWSKRILYFALALHLAPGMRFLAM